MSGLKIEDFPPAKEVSNENLVSRLKRSISEIQNILSSEFNIPFKNFEYEIKRIENFVVSLKKYFNEGDPVEKILAPFKETSTRNIDYKRKDNKESFEISFDQSEKCFSLKSEYQADSNKRRKSKAYLVTNNFHKEYDFTNNFEAQSTIREESEVDPLFNRDSKYQDLRKRVFSKTEKNQNIFDFKKGFKVADCLNTRESIRETLNKENEISLNSTRGYKDKRRDKDELKREFKDTLRSMKKSSRKNSISSDYKRTETPLKRDSFLSNTFSSKKKTNSCANEEKLKAWNYRIKNSFEARFNQFKFR